MRFPVSCLRTFFITPLELGLFALFQFLQDMKALFQNGRLFPHPDAGFCFLCVSRFPPHFPPPFYRVRAQRYTSCHEKAMLSAVSRLASPQIFFYIERASNEINLH
jgi:hypothetical protein